MKRGAATPSPTPIPVEGDVQVFADAACTQYPENGQQYDQVYVRINTPWVGSNSGYVSAQGANQFIALPTSSASVNPSYGLNLWVDYNANNGDTPYVAGQVVEVPIPDRWQLSDCVFIFTKP